MRSVFLFLAFSALIGLPRLVDEFRDRYADEVNSAIQKELSRLDYYGGRITREWSKSIRHAARDLRRWKGNHERHLHSSVGFLASWQTANPLKALEAIRDAGAIYAVTTPEPAQASAKESLSKEADTSEITTRHDDYLPPWMQDGEVDGGFSPPASVAPRQLGKALDTAKASKKTSHKRHRVARASRQRYASYRELARRGGRSVSYSPFLW